MDANEFQKLVSESSINIEDELAKIQVSIARISKFINLPIEALMGHHISKMRTNGEDLPQKRMP